MPNSGLIKIKLEFINITNESKEIHEMRKKKTYRNNEDISAGLLEMSFVICYWLLLLLVLLLLLLMLLFMLLLLFIFTLFRFDHKRHQTRCSFWFFISLFHHHFYYIAFAHELFVHVYSAKL